MTRDQIHQWLLDGDLTVVLADGFEDAFLGVGSQFNTTFAVYDRAKCIEILMIRAGMDEEDAEEFFSFNVTGAWVGEQTPCFLEFMPKEKPTCRTPRQPVTRRRRA